MKTWVRTDGVILRQEVPFPFVRLVLERRPEADASSRHDPQTRSARLMIELSRRDQAVRDQVRRRPARPRGPAGRAVRVSRAQRRGQDDHDQDDLRAAGARPRARSGSAASTRRASRPANCSAMFPISRIFTTS